MQFPRACLLALLAGMSTPTSLDVAAQRAAVDETRVPAERSRPGADAVEQRYRIAGRVRLALFWVGRDDVGSARMSWRSDGATSAMALLIGSDPDRAPRGLNQWAYLREELRAESAEVFSVRSIDGDGDREGQSDGFGVGDGPDLGVSCASIAGDEVSSRHTTVPGRGVSYRMFEQLLARISTSVPWERRQAAVPVGVKAGFLTAIQHAMRLDRAVGADRGHARIEAVPYVYNNAVYDLTVQRRQRLGRRAVGAATFEQLERLDFSIRNRRTGDVSSFGITYEPDYRRAPLPVQIFYQPNFWLRVELRRDDTADVPADPAADRSVLGRIRAICDGGTETQ